MYVLRKVRKNDLCLGTYVISYSLTDNVKYDHIGLYSLDDGHFINWIEDFDVKHEAGLITDLPLLNDGVLTLNDYRVKYTELN